MAFICLSLFHSLPPPPKPQSKIWQTWTFHPCSLIPLNPLFCWFHFNFIQSLLLSCNLAAVEEERCVFLLSSRSCLNIDRDWTHRWLLSVTSEGGQGWQSFRADFIWGAETWKYGSNWITSPRRCSTSLHYPPACLTPCNVFQWRCRLEGDGV